MVAVAITNHFVWADFPNFLKQLADQVAITGRGHWAATDNPAAFYVSVLDRFGPGWPLLCLAAGFTVAALCGGGARQLAFLGFPLLYLWFMTKRPSQFSALGFPAGAVRDDRRPDRTVLRCCSSRRGRCRAGARAASELARLAATAVVAAVLWQPAQRRRRLLSAAA